MRQIFKSITGLKKALMFLRLASGAKTSKQAISCGVAPDWIINVEVDIYIGACLLITERIGR